MKKIFSAMVVVAALFAGYSTYNTQNDDELTDLALANIEALAGNDETSGSNYNICYSESKVSKGRTYYDCGSCKKVYDEKGVGTESKCFY